MSADQPWTIERICDALGTPALSTRFLGEINRSPAHEMLAVFAKWQGIAERLLITAQRVTEAKAAQEAGLPVPGEWTDITEKVQAEAAGIRAHRAA